MRLGFSQRFCVDRLRLFAITIAELWLQRSAGDLDLAVDFAIVFANEYGVSYEHA